MEIGDIKKKIREWNQDAKVILKEWKLDSSCVVF